MNENKPKPDNVYVCPECGSALINRGGCVVCSNPNCIYEGCDI